MTRILIVEDSPTQAQQLQLILESTGFQIVVARSGEEALDKVKRDRFDLVITDIVMPGISGFDLCRKLKHDPKHAETPVIMLTTLVDPMDMIQALECGADNYVTKPYEPDYLLTRINTILNNARGLIEGKFEMGVEIHFLGKRFNITSEKKQILNLLISTFEDIVRTNHQLKEKQHELSRAKAKIEEYAHQLEGMVRLSEEKYQLIMREASDAIAVTDIHGTIIEVNRQAEKLVDRSREDLIGKNIDSVIASREKAHLGVLLETLAREGELRNVEIAIVRRDGAERYVEVSARQIELNGEVLRIGILRDISERKEHEERLRESEERYRNLIEGSLQGLAIVQDERIVFCNQALANIYGYDHAAEMTGAEAIQFVAPEDREQVKANRDAHLRGEPVAPTIEYRGIRRDGSIIWLLSHRQQVQWEGRTAMQATHIDVTGQKQLEEQLLAAQRMEAVGRLAGGIAHDFNNMLAVTSSYSGFVLDQLGPDHPARADVEVILDSASRAAALTRQLLAFSRHQVLQMKPIELNSAVRNMERMLHRVIGEDITLRTNLGSDVKRIRADESQIEQIIMNLAVNARDAMATGGRLTIETANTLLDENYASSHLDARPGPYVLLAVTDTGTGMDEQTRQRIFEPFFTTKPVGKGTGLGLSTVFGIVKQMGGSIWVYSELNKGTSFKIYFPVTEDLPTEEKSPETAPEPAKSTGTILLLEDDDQVRAAASRILESGGYRVLSASEGPAAIEIFRSRAGQINLLLTDVVLSGMSGKDVYETIHRTSPIPVLFMSGYTDDSIVNHGILEGNYPFVHKPFTKNSLLGKVREVLSHSEGRSDLEKDVPEKEPVKEGDQDTRGK